MNLRRAESVNMPRGRSARSVLSDSSEMDSDGTESEIARLQRQFRILEADRQAYGAQAREQIRKQQQEIEWLTKEQEELKYNLAACKSLSRQQQDREDTQSLKALLEQRDMLEEELEKEKKHQKELEKETSSMEMKLAELKKGKVTASDTQSSKVQRSQQTGPTLEYQLDKAMARLSMQLNRNSDLREELYTLRIEHARFLQLQNRLDKERQEVRKKIEEMINVSSAAYNARAEAQSKMTMMREKAVKDLAQYNTEMKELERVIAHEFSLKEFLSTKCDERMSRVDSQEMGHKQLPELKERGRINSGEESPDALEEVFNRLQSLTGEDNLDMLVTRFIQGEDRNFALFNFVNEQNNEAEAMKDHINQIQGEMERCHVEGSQQQQDHHSSLKNIDEQRKKSKSQAEEYENKVGIINKILDQIKTGVNSIISKVECDSSVIDDKLGSSSGISENNIMSYLGLVEKKTNELLTIQAFLDYKDLERDYNPRDLAKFLFGQNPEMLQDNVTIQSSVERVDYDAEDCPVTDEEERPLSQGELRKRILKGVLQKESSVRKAATKASHII